MRKAGAVIAVLFAFPLVAQRLPKTVIPHHYELTFAPDFTTDTFRGEAEIDVGIQQPTRDVTLHALQIAFEDVAITAGGKKMTGSATVNAADQTATLSFPEALPIGPARLHIRFTGILNSELRGLYLGTTDGRKYAATQMEATDARRAFPSFDEPELKATFSVTAIVDANDTAISNGAVVSDSPGPTGKRTVRFATTPRMSTYLVALVVGPFQCVEGGLPGIPMRVCAPPDKVHLGRMALSMSESFTRYFNDYFGVPYAFGKLDHIGIPDFAAGAMENSGAVIYRDIFLLKDPQTASVESQKGTAGIVSHEIAHMWFGDLVTMRWWDDLWLNEGFASWIASKPIQQMHPEWKIAIDDVAEITHPMNTDSLRNTRPIKVDVNNPSEAEELFDAITYGKAAAVLGMVESFIGEETFQRGVSAYIKEHSFGNATADDFSAALSRAAGAAAVDRILDTFVKQPGVPLITTETACVNGRTIVKARQQRFFIDQRQARRDSPELWHIPVCFRSAGSDRQTCKIFGERTQTFRADGCTAPVFLNARGKGYYLTATDDRELMRLSGRLSDLTDAETIAFLRDEWLLVRATRRHLPAFLTLAESVFATKRERAVMDELLGSLASVVSWLPDSELSGYRSWLAAQLRPVAQELGWEAAENEDADRGLLRAKVIETLAVSARDANTIAESRRRARQYLANPESVHPALVSAVLAGAAVEGDEALYDQVLRRYQQTKAPEQRQHLLRMLSLFRDPRLMRRSLDRALLNETRITEAGTYIGSVLRSREGRDLAWQFITSRWPEVDKKIPPGPFGSLVHSAAAFCDPAMRNEVKEFFTEHKREATERALAQAIEAIDLCIQTSRFQAPKVAEWLAHRQQTASN